MVRASIKRLRRKAASKRAPAGRTPLPPRDMRGMAAPLPATPHRERGF